ncbi:leiomodin-3 [Trichomycterus rosablanca]|uniref:leiomodin-3 n=1 Tax=Trichomycterus rosablanca TaxID=2290929 RepID=UPI002F3545F1
MSSHCNQDMDDMDDIDEDKILEGLSVEELKQLQNEIDMIADDRKMLGDIRQNNVSHYAVTEENKEEGCDEEIDEDMILAGLSAEELKQLQNEMEVIAPDERVPVGMRQKDQTEKPPTGSFDHRSLVDYLYWERESKRLIEEERIPTTLLPSLKEMEDEMKNAVKELDNEAECVNKEEAQETNLEDDKVKEEMTEEVTEKIVDVDNFEKQKRLSINTKSNENNTTVISSQALLQSHPDFSDSKKEEEPHRLEQNKEDLMVDKGKEVDQNKSVSAYENWVPEKEERVISKLKIPKLALGNTLIKKTARPSGNDTNLEGTLAKIRHQNPSITDVNLNNIENIPKEMLLEYIEALKKNKHVKTFSIANTGADETVAFSLANMLRENRSITTLNIESNFITGKGIIAIMRCLQFNETLTELRFHNQRHILGHHAEMEVARLLKSNNTLLKMGYHFELPGPRMVVTNLLTRNLDRQRQQRKEEQRLQQMKEQQHMMKLYENRLNMAPGLLEMLGGYIPEMELVKVAQVPQQLSQGFQEPSMVLSKSKQVHKMPLSPTSDSVEMFKELQLKKTPRRRDPLLELNPKEERSGGRTNIQLHSTPKHKITATEEHLDDKASLKDVIKGLKPVPRRREPPKVDLTPRDLLLSEIRQSNVAYLKSVPLPKVLESAETSLF